MNCVFGCLRKTVVAFRQQLFERHATRLVVAAIGKQGELQPPLVVHVERLEEFLRLGRVDEDGNAQTTERRPDRIELGIVDAQPRAIGLSVAKAERLRHFTDADRAGLDVGFELRHGPRAPVGSHIIEIDAGQHTKSILVRARVDGGERARQPIARRVVGAHHHAQVQLVHLRDNAVDRFGAGERGRMPVYVDRRKLRPRHRMLRRDERRPRMVVDDARRRELGRLAHARPCFSRPRWTFLPRREPDTIPAPLRAHRHAERGDGYGQTTNERARLSFVDSNRVSRTVDPR